MSTSKIIGEVSELFNKQGGCYDPMKTVIAIDYAVESSVIDINELNAESEKGCLFVAKDGTIYDGVSSGEESEAQYKLVPTGLITKFNNVPLLASFCKDKDRTWRGAYVGTLDKLFDTYKEFYKGQHEFSEQYIDLCFSEKPLLNIYGFGLKEIVNNPYNYVFVKESESNTIYTSGNAVTQSVGVGVQDKVTKLKKSLEKAETQINTTRLSKAKRRKLEARINQLKSDISKEETLIANNEQEQEQEVKQEVEVTATNSAIEGECMTDANTSKSDKIEVAHCNELTDTSLDADNTVNETSVTDESKPRRGRKPAAKGEDKQVARKRARTKADIEAELASAVDSIEVYKARIAELEKQNKDIADSNTSADETKFNELESAKSELEEKNKRLLDANIELSRQIESLRKSDSTKGNTNNTTTNSNVHVVENTTGIDTSKFSDEASEIIEEDGLDAAGIKTVCEVIYKKLINKERWATKSGDSALKLYIKPLMQFVYNSISKSKPGDGLKDRGPGYVFSSNHKKLLINTNLIDCYGNDIYIIDHTPTEKSYKNKTITVMQSKSSLVADGFTVESIRQLPGHVKFFDKSEYVFNACIEDFDLEDDEHLDHIINDRRNRFPSHYRNVSAKIIADKLKNSVEQAIKISEIDYRYIMPMYNPKLNELEFLIPFYLDNHYGQKPELTIIVSKKQSFWKVFTIIKNEYAYFNARLLCNPNDSVF